MQPPSDPPAPVTPRWVSFSEAQKILSLTEGTLRRAIKAGTIQGEQRRRNPDSPTDQRMVYEVLVMDAPAVAAPAAPIEAVSAIESATEAPVAITGLLAIVDAERAERQRVMAENAALREQIGTLRERAESLAVERAQAKLERDELRQEVRELKDRPWWRKVWR